MDLEKTTIDSIQKNKNTVISINPNEYLATSNELMKQLTGQGKTLVINMTNSIEALEKKIEEQGGNLENSSYICVSNNPNQKENPRCEFITRQSDLTALGIRLNKSLSKNQNKFMIFDSVSTLLVYNDQVKTIKFLNFVMSKIRDSNTSAVYIVMKEDFKKIASSISLFADNIIEQ